MASSGRRRCRLGGVTDGRETGIGLHDGNDTAGRLRERRCHYCDVQNRKKYGRGEGETDMWGPRVRKFLYLNPNFWIVTGDETGCSWTSTGGELHNGEPDGIEPRRGYGDGDLGGGRRRGRLLTARSDNLLHGDHEMPTMMCRTPSCMRAERKHARTGIKQIR